MSNELILIISLIGTYTAVLIWFTLFGENGLFCFSVVATITANIEVLILINAYGMEQTLGNILFGATFLITDILSEVKGKKTSQKAVNMCMCASVCFIFLSQSWFLYTPSENDTIFSSISAVFSNTPRVMITSLIVYFISQRFDVWVYHKWWNLTTKKFGDPKKYLWLRNNGSTLLSQLINNILFTFGSFLFVYDLPTLIDICISSYTIFIVTSLADTPALYLARYIHLKKQAKIKNTI